MKLKLETLKFIKTLSISLLATAFLILSACTKSETPDVPASPPKEEIKTVNPDDYLGCKRECLKGSALCLKMGAQVFGNYKEDLEKLFSDARKILTAEESQIDIAKDPVMDMKYMIIFSAQSIPVRQADINDPDLEILSSHNRPPPVFKFKSDVIDSDYGGSVTRIQFHQGLPIFTTASGSCIGVF